MRKEDPSGYQGRGATIAQAKQHKFKGFSVADGLFPERQPQGKKASPLMMPKSSLLSAITSAFDRYTKYMNRWQFLFLMLYLVDQYNEDIANNK